MGLPMTILSNGTPAYELISRTDVSGQLDALESTTSDCGSRQYSFFSSFHCKQLTWQSS